MVVKAKHRGFGRLLKAGAILGLVLTLAGGGAAAHAVGLGLGELLNRWTVFLGLGALVALYAHRRLRIARLVTVADATAPGAVEDGTVRVTGRVIADDDTVASPIAGADCVAYRWTRRRRSESRRLRSRHSARALAFVVESETEESEAGRVRIAGGGAYLALTNDERSGRIPLLSTAEGRLEPGDGVTVYGTVGRAGKSGAVAAAADQATEKVSGVVSKLRRSDGEDSEDLAVVGGRGTGPLLITDRSHAAVLLRSWATVFAVVGLAGGLVGVWLAGSLGLFGGLPIP